MVDQAMLADEQYLEAFLECRLTAASFNHHAHVRIAWLLLRRYSSEVAVERMCDGVARLAMHFRVPGKYHRTLTESAMRLMAYGGATDPGMSWENFMSSNSRLMTNFRDLLADYYSEGRLMSEAARTHFVSPDLRPLPALFT